MSKARKLLEESNPFKEFDSGTLDQFREMAEEKTFAPDQVIFNEMTEGDEIYFIVEAGFELAWN